MDYTFLMCSERSGSNLLTKIMDKHSQYCGPSPTHLFRILLENRRAYGDLNDNNNWRKLVTDVLSLFDVKLGLWKSAWQFKELDELIYERSLKSVFCTIYEKEASAHGKSRLFIKENHIYRFLPFIQSAFPEAKFVYLVRDPRDMALSWKKSPSLRGGIIRAAKVWNSDQSAGLNISALLKDEQKILLLRYEDLLREPARQLQILCNFLNIGFEPEMIDFHADPYTNETANRAAEWQNLQKPLLKGNYNKYKKELSESEIRFIEGHSDDLMQALGYTPELGRNSDLDKIEKAILPGELYEKPDYLKLPESERRARAGQAAVFEQIRNRRRLPVLDA